MWFSLIKKLAILIGACFLIFLNILVWHNIWLGIVLFFGYLFLLSSSAKNLLIKFFSLSDNGGTRVLGAFLVFIFLSWLSGIAVVFYKLTPVTIVLDFLVIGSVFIFWELWSKYAKNMTTAVPAEIKDSPFKLPNVFWGVLVFLIFVGYGFYLLYHSQSGTSLISPWQTINPNYLWTFLGATFLLGLLIFSRLSAKTLLIFLTVYIFLLSSYLPLTHQLFYGADQWRHLATESRIMSGLPLNAVSPVGVQPLFLTTAPGNIFYSNFWGINIVLAQVLNVGLISLVKWLLPVLWAVVFPILIYQIGLAINFNKKESLFLVWLMALPFALQYAGALSIPNHFGLLVWLLLVLFTLKTTTSFRWEQVIILAVLGLLSVFGYGLYLLLFWLSALALVILRQSRRIPSMWSFPAIGGSAFGGKGFFPEGVPLGRLLRMTIVTLLLAVSIPAVELIVKYSSWPKQVDWFAQVKQLCGNFTGWYLATGPRSHDILTGNIFFNQVPLSAFVPNFLTQYPMWIFIFMIFVWVIILVGIISSFRSNQVVKNWLGVMFAGLLGSYIIGRYILVGQSIISRRLDGVLAILGVIMLVLGIKWLVGWCNQKKLSKRIGRALLPIFIFIISLAITASYSLGPDIRAMSTDEYNVIKYVFADQGKCVIADTYPLLALEYLSQKQITGGGFPMGQDFSQPDRVALFNEMKNNPNYLVWSKARAIVNSNECYFIFNTKDIHYNDYTYQEGEKWKMFGGMVVWSHNL
ncbi:MAG: hypothetical protein WCX97_01765 [Candidatus Magasanikbacteria bacterium]